MRKERWDLGGQGFYPTHKRTQKAWNGKRPHKKRCSSNKLEYYVIQNKH
jgi:hypothetical protein